MKTALFALVLASSSVFATEFVPYGADLNCAGAFIETAVGLDTVASGNNPSLGGNFNISVSKNAAGQYSFRGFIMGQRRSYGPSTEMTESRMNTLSTATIAVTNHLFEIRADKAVFCQLKGVVETACAGQIGGSGGIIATVVTRQCGE